MDSNNWRVKRDPSDSSAAATPNRSFQQRRSNGFNESRDSPRNGDSSSSFSSPVGRSPFQSRDSARKPLNESSSNKAIEEGRRLYVGNLPYDTTVKDIEALFQDVDGVEGINMAIDPMTGRNPSYCFVDLVSKDLAEGVMEMYNGRLFRERALRVKPGVKSGTGTGRYDMKPRQPGAESHVFNRWDRNEKPEDLNESATTQGRRVFVGGIPTFGTRAECEANIQDLFSGYRVEVIGKSIPGYESRNNQESVNKNYCFVDLATADDAAKAIESLDGISRWNGVLTVKPSRGRSARLGERRRLFIAGLPEFPDQETTESRIRELFDGYELTSITKLFLPKDESKKAEGNHCFCFVEVSSDEDADRAQKSLDWKEMWDSVIRVKPASSGASDKGGKESGDRTVKERQTWR